MKGWILLGVLALAAAPWSGMAQGKAEPRLPPHIDGDLAYHHHPLLRFVIYAAGAGSSPLPKLVGLVTPPAGLGIDVIEGKKKFREIHTHEGISGRLHTESVDPLKKYRLADFLALWRAADPEVVKLLARARSEGTVYLFDHNRTRGTFYATRLADATKLAEITLDDGRHIVVYLPERKKQQGPDRSTASPRRMQN